MLLFSELQANASSVPAATRPFQRLYPQNHRWRISVSSWVVRLRYLTMTFTAISSTNDGIYKKNASLGGPETRI
jgi:hypothetical protein